MKVSEMVLRTKLRAVNIEYSALVRGNTGEGRFVRMEELRVERRALMALIAAQRLGDRQHPASAAVGAAASSIDAPAAGGAFTLRRLNQADRGGAALRSPRTRRAWGSGEQ